MFPIVMTCNPRRALGIGLVEVLIALLVVSFGLVGIAALTMKSLGANRTAILRARAALLTAGMADRIRAHRHGDDAYDCGGACEPNDGGNPLAVHDIANWIASVSSELPAGRAEIMRRHTPYSAPATYVVRVSWDEAGGDRNSFDLIVQCGDAT